MKKTAYILSLGFGFVVLPATLAFAALEVPGNLPNNPPLQPIPAAIVPNVARSSNNAPPHEPDVATEEATSSAEGGAAVGQGASVVGSTSALGSSSGLPSAGKFMWAVLVVAFLALVAWFLWPLRKDE